jgi:uncharacterized protein DUF5995
MFPYDRAILSAVQNPPASIPDVIGIMQAIDALCSDGDGLKWFNRLYLDVTTAVAARVNAGGFADPAWMAALDVNFARLYFDAVAAALSSAPTPACWRALFTRRDQVLLARIQFAIAGVNAHINHDLPIALINTGPAPVHGSPHYLEYTAVNTTLCALVDQAKAELHVRLLGDLLPPVSTLEDTLAAFSMSAAREAAWNHGEILWSIRRIAPMYGRTLDMLDGMTAVIGKTLLIPVPLV